MDTPKEEPKPVDNMELLKQQAAACGADCACHSTTASGRLRGVLGIIILFVAVALVTRAVVKNRGASTEPAASAFPTLTPVATAGSEIPVSPVPPGTATEIRVGTNIVALAELNKLAASNDAVFVYVPARDGASGASPEAFMKSAVSRINAQGHNVGLFTLERDSPEYAQLAAQMSVPGVLALVKGRGMSPVTGEITETKLIQGFVAAASVNCGPNGCGPAGCGPTTK